MRTPFLLLFVILAGCAGPTPPPPAGQGGAIRTPHYLSDGGAAGISGAAKATSSGDQSSAVYHAFGRVELPKPAGPGDVLGRFKREMDELDEVVRYHHALHGDQFIERLRGRAPMLEVVPMIGHAVGDGAPVMVLRVYYQGKPLLFLGGITVRAGGETFHRLGVAFKRKFLSIDRVEEAATLSVTPEDLRMLRAMADSESVVVRARGRSDHMDFTLSSIDRLIIADTLTAYEVLRQRASR